MAMLELPQAAGYLAGVRMYTEVELLGRKRVPNGRQLDTFADALASLEYYLEALRENRLNRENLLEIARGSLETLGRSEARRVGKEGVRTIISWWSAYE